MQRLKSLSNECNFADATGVPTREAAIRDAFKAGLSSSYIRQRILEKNVLQLNAVFNKARSLDEAHKNASIYESVNVHGHRNTLANTVNHPTVSESDFAECSAEYAKVCYFCWGLKHARANCPAKQCSCFKCGRKGHFAKVFRSKETMPKCTATVVPDDPNIAVLSSTKHSNDENVNIFVLVNGMLANCLLDTGAKQNHISTDFQRRAKIKVQNVASGQESMKVDLAVKEASVKTLGCCAASVELKGCNYRNINFSVMNGLLWDVILGRDFLSQHQNVNFNFGGPKTSLELGALKPIKCVEPVKLFEHMSPNCEPVAVRRRNYSKADQSFISDQVSQLLEDDLIEPSTSPWRAQVVVVKNENHKKRMCVDYSQTVNKFTYFDAYPLPSIQDIIGEVSQYRWYSTLDLKSAYHQVMLLPEEQKYTAFEAGSHLYEFKRVPFGLKNAVPCFQRVINQIILKYNCKGTFAYLDDITVCGRTREEHDKNLEIFLNAAQECNLTLNEKKCAFATTAIKLLGYQISDGMLKPDPDRVKPILKLPIPTNAKELSRVVGIFSYYAQWLPKFSEKIKPLIIAKNFPLDEKDVEVLNLLKNDLASAALQIIDESIAFVTETDASENAISATLNQNNRPVAFFSRMSKSERYHSSVEKEASATVKAVRKWTHFLSGRHFTIITDQQSVVFMYSSTNYGKIKNEKIMRWRMQLSEYDFWGCLSEKCRKDEFYLTYISFFVSSCWIL